MTNTFFDHLEFAIKQDYIAVNTNSNPFSVDLNLLSQKSLFLAVGQYSVFPRNIVSCIIEAIYSLSFHEWFDVSDELIINVNEELGYNFAHKLVPKTKKTFQPQPHYTILKQGLYQGLDFDIQCVSPDNNTDIFISTLKSQLSHINSAHVAGAMYAIESSAVPELDIVYLMVRRLFELNNKVMPIFLQDFFKQHIETIEVGHRQRLQDNIIKYLPSTELKDHFVNGHHSVMSEMDRWWGEMFKLYSK